MGYGLLKKCSLGKRLVNVGPIELNKNVLLNLAKNFTTRSLTCDFCALGQSYFLSGNIQGVIQGNCTASYCTIGKIVFISVHKSMQGLRPIYFRQQSVSISLFIDLC